MTILFPIFSTTMSPMNEFQVETSRVRDKRKKIVRVLFIALVYKPLGTDTIAL